MVLQDLQNQLHDSYQYTDKVASQMQNDIIENNPNSVFDSPYLHQNIDRVFTD